MLSIIPLPKQMKLLEGTVPADAQVTVSLDASMPDEAYRLTINSGGVEITGGSENAVLYGKTTLEQIRFQCVDDLPCIEIEDSPAYAWRSFHLDCVRHFFPLSEVKKMLRTASLFKFNRFHWHLSDDQGFRMEIPSMPELNEISSTRAGDHFGRSDTGTPETYYYTQDEIRDIVAYAKELGIEIVPEIDMPGHVTAILAAHPELSCTGEKVEVGTRQGIYRDIFCPGKEETFAFIERLLDEVIALFPFEYIHIGGDECPKDNWRTCPHCRKRMEQEGLDSFQELQGYMENRIIDWLATRGRKAIVWNEACYGRNLSPSAMVQMWTADRDGAVASHIRNGGKVLYSLMINSYCDYPPGFISLRNLYRQLKPGPGFDAEYLSDTAGTECLLWTEYIRDDADLESHAWPRFAASAERGWSGENGSSYGDFRRRLSVLFPIFAKHGVRAAPREDWRPGPLRTVRQLLSFLGNFTPEDIRRMLGAKRNV